MNYLQAELIEAFEACRRSEVPRDSYLSYLSRSDYDALVMHWQLHGPGTTSLLSYAGEVRRGRVVI